MTEMQETHKDEFEQELRYQERLNASIIKYKAHIHRLQTNRPKTVLIDNHKYVHDHN
jgi:hypothetical protein